jgi:hypothetical protein
VERTRGTVKHLEPQEPRQPRITIGSVYYKEKAELLQMDQCEFGGTSPKSSVLANVKYYFTSPISLTGQVELDYRIQRSSMGHSASGALL